MRPRSKTFLFSNCFRKTVNCHTSWSAGSRINVMEDKRDEVHYTFADNLAPYFLLIFTPVLVIFCLFGIFYTYLTTEVRKYLGFFLVRIKCALKTPHVNHQFFNYDLSASLLLRCFHILPRQKSKLLTPWERKINMPRHFPLQNLLKDQRCRHSYPHRNSL